MASTKGRVEVLPFRLSESGFIHVAVTINGRGPFNFVLDTGSNRSAVTTKIAAELELKQVAVTGLVTSASERAVTIVRIGSFALGGLLRSGVLATVLADRDAAALGGDADGIIGQDVLGDSNYTIDYQHQRLLWGVDEAAPTPGTARLSLRRDEGRWLVALPQDKQGGEIVWFVPDSGATSFVVFDRGLKSPLHVTPLPAGAEVKSVTGGRQVQTAVLRQLRVGKVVFRNRPTLLIDRHEPNAPAGDGLLPLSEFVSVSFNASEGFLIVRGRQ